MSTTANAECKQDPGVFVPIINRSRCEGKEDCVEICPYHVFEMGTLAARIAPRYHSHHASRPGYMVTAKPSP